MHKYTEAVDVYSVLKPVFFASKVLGLSPYNAVGNAGNRRITVTVSAIAYSLGMLIVNVGVFAYGAFTRMFSWENICSSGESVLCLGTLCTAISAYFTCLFGCKQIARQLERINILVGETYSSAWKRDLLLLLTTQTLFVILTVIAGVLEISRDILAFYETHMWFFCMFYYLSDFASFVSEHQFIVIIHTLKLTVHNWNNHIDDATKIDDVGNDTFDRNEKNIDEYNLPTVSSTSVTSNRLKIQSKVVHFQELRKLYASACDIAESVNAIYSPLLLVSIARFFTSLTHILYYILMSFVVQKASSFCDLTANVSYFVLLICYSLRLLSLVYYTTFTAKEVSHKF
jgi:hypothetical protein